MKRELALLLGTLVTLGCSSTVSETERQLLSVLDTYEAQNLRVQERIERAAERGIENLSIDGTGLNARVSAALNGASRSVVVMRVLKHSAVPFHFNEAVLGGDITATFSNLSILDALNLLVADDGIEVGTDGTQLVFKISTPTENTTVTPVAGQSSTAPNTAFAAPMPSSQYIVKKILLEHTDTIEAANFLLSLVPNSGVAPSEVDFAQTGTIDANTSYPSSSSTYQSGYSSASTSPTLPVGINSVRFATRPSENVVFLYGPSEQVLQATQYLRKLDTPRDHVIIEAFVVEVDTEAFDALKSTITSLANGRWSGVMSDFGSLLGGNLSFTNTAGAHNATAFSALIEFLVGQNVARVVTRPYVSTLSGKAATVNITSDRYLLVQQAQGGATVTTPSSISAGVVLKIVPTVIGRGSVRLKIDVEESDFGVPSENVAVEVDKNNATNIAQVPNGKSVIVGGLMLNRNINLEAGFPYLRHVPLLNLLFANQRSERKTQEVIAIVTPHIWNPDLETPLAEPVPLTLEGKPSLLSDFERNGRIPHPRSIIRDDNSIDPSS